MTDITVSKLADTIGTTVDKLLSQLQEAGINISDKDAAVTDTEKRQLLTYLRQSSGSTDNKDSGKKITLKRKSVSTLKVGKTATHKKTVQVEVRKKKTYVQNKVLLEEQKKNKRKKN
jgi:translation initiation factor IF-2